MKKSTAIACSVFASAFLVSLLAIASSAMADAALDKGKEIYNGVGACSACHGAMGKGDGPAGGALTPKPANFSLGSFKYDTNKDGTVGTEADLLDVVTKGAAAFGGSGTRFVCRLLPEGALRCRPLRLARRTELPDSSGRPGAWLFCRPSSIGSRLFRLRLALMVL